MHACVLFGGSQVMLAEENLQYGAWGPKTLKGSPITIHLQVANADETMARGSCCIEDPFGHRWAIATHVRDGNPQEMQEAMTKMGA